MLLQANTYREQLMMTLKLLGERGSASTEAGSEFAGLAAKIQDSLDNMAENNRCVVCLDKPRNIVVRAVMRGGVGCEKKMQR